LAGELGYCGDGSNDGEQSSKHAGE